MKKLHKISSTKDSSRYPSYFKAIHIVAHRIVLLYALHRPTKTRCYALLPSQLTVRPQSSHPYSSIFSESHIATLAAPIMQNSSHQFSSNVKSPPFITAVEIALLENRDKDSILPILWHSLLIYCTHKFCKNTYIYKVYTHFSHLLASPELPPVFPFFNCCSTNSTFPTGRAPKRSNHCMGSISVSFHSYYTS